MGNDLKGTGNNVGYLVLKKVSKNLPLLISSPTQTSCPMLYLPASSSAPASSQDSPWARAGEVREQGGGESKAKEGVTMGVRTSWVLGHLKNDGCFVSFD